MTRPDDKDQAISPVSMHSIPDESSAVNSDDGLGLNSRSSSDKVEDGELRRVAQGIEVEKRGNYVYFHIDHDAIPFARMFLPETGMIGRTASGHECWGYYSPGFEVESLAGAA